MTKAEADWFSEAPGHVQNWAALEALISFLHEHILKNGFNYVGFEQPNSSVFQIWWEFQENFTHHLGKQNFISNKKISFSGVKDNNIASNVLIFISIVTKCPFTIIFLNLNITFFQKYRE